LDYVFEEFEKRGVYSETGDAPSKTTPAEKDKEVQP
jgi:hypothetical protein